MGSRYLRSPVRITHAATIRAAPAHTATVGASDVYVRRGGKWLSLYYQETRLQ